MFDMTAWPEQTIAYLRESAELTPDAPLPAMFDSCPVFYLSADGSEWCANCANQSDADPEIIAFQTLEPGEESRTCSGCGVAIAPDREYDPHDDYNVGQSFTSDAGVTAEILAIYQSDRGEWYVTYATFARGELPPMYAPDPTTEQTQPANMFAVEYNAFRG